MLTGHLAFAAGVRGRTSSTPLWALLVAAQWLDLVALSLTLVGVEAVSTDPAAPKGYGSLLIHADYSHSLVGAIALSVVLGSVAGLRWGRRSALLVGAVAFSHWPLDLIVHRADLPILPDGWGTLRVGFGLWRLPIISGVLEFAMLIIGVALYWQKGRSVKATAVLLVFLLAILLLDVTGVLSP